MAERYDRVNLLIPKGQKELIAAAAEKAEETISRYILAATLERMEREKE
jgi:uncharacterized protein (DUF1778 family)